MQYALEISKPHRDEFIRRFPAVPLSGFIAVLCTYSIAKGEPELAAGAIRNELDEVASRAWEFASYLRRIGHEAGDQISLQALLRGYGAGMVNNLVSAADGLGGCAEMARRSVEGSVAEGRPIAPETRLIRSLARLLATHGEVVSAKPSGPLCTAFDLAAEVAVCNGLLDHKPKDVRGTVANALKDWDKE